MTSSAGTHTRESQAAATPAEVLEGLLAGNARFAAGERTDRDLPAQVAATADAQHPVAAIVGCVDSRVPVELVFDLGIGDAIVARTAGHVVDDAVLGSLEFATELAGTPVVVVLGHTGCGAVMGACDGVTLGHLTGLLEAIRPAVEEASGGDPTPGSDDPALVDRAVEANVRRTVAGLTERSEVLAAREQAETLAIAGAVYDLTSGRVRWL